MDNFLPVHRRVGYALASSFIAFSGWAVFGELDITASSQGKLVPASFVKVAQPSESGPVRKVLVADGSTVKAGQPLVELDPVFIESDIAAAHSEVDRLTLQLGRIEAELQNKPFNPAAGLDATATSGLDSATAEHIGETVNMLRGTTTVLFVAHKVPTCLKVDTHVLLASTGA